MAALFFDKLGSDPRNFIAELIQEEMDEALIELFNTLGGRLEIDDMDQDRFRSSLLIIGYLVRAYEEKLVASRDDPPPADDQAPEAG